MNLRHVLRRKETSLLLVIIGIGILISLVNPKFFTASNLTDVVRSYTVHGIVAMGMLLVIVTAGIDVSVGSMAAAVTVVVGTFLVDVGGGLLTIFVVGCLSGMLFGLFNGFFISKLQIPAIVVTLGSLSLFRGLELYATGGSWITGLPEWFIAFGQLKPLGIPVQIYFWILTALLTYYLLTFTRVGRGVYAVGGNAEAATRVGYKRDRLLLLVWAYLGLMVGLAAVVHTSIYRQVDPNAFAWFELTVIAATVLGGANIMGGEGSVLGTIFGVLLLAVVENGLILARIPSYWHEVIVGGVIITAVSIDVIQVRRRERSMARIDVEGRDSSVGGLASTEEEGRP
jgi:ribose/xylose/arabinose/galactoside ABC-type transport system permease subunit